MLLTNESTQAGRIVSADAVRFGAGKGVIARNGLVSGRPKYAEGARYYLQYAGMPDTLVYSLNRDTSDYKDDYQSRAEYLNYLHGAPYGPNRDRQVPGLGIPIDLSLAFHTDAGITANDTVVGTLSIYTIEAMDSARVFPDSMSRMANRDLADLHPDADRGGHPRTPRPGVDQAAAAQRRLQRVPQTQRPLRAFGAVVPPEFSGHAVHA